MAGNLVVCSMDAELEAEMKEFRKKKLKVGSALIMKVSKCLYIYSNNIYQKF